MVSFCWGEANNKEGANEPGVGKCEARLSVPPALPQVTRHRIPTKPTGS